MENGDGRGDSDERAQDLEKVQEGYAGRRVEIFLLCALVLSVALLAQFSWSFSQGPNNRNVTIDTTLNVTGSAPEILSAAVTTPITLRAGYTTPVTCNTSIRDYNGFADIDNVWGEFFSIGSSSWGAADNNNTHYTNSSCAAIDQNGLYANYTCTFNVNYYALNDTWNCTVIVNDTLNLRDNTSLTANILQVLALNVTPLIDYGQMAMGDTSTDQEANVSNLGNVDINVSVRGYGNVSGDGWSFICDQGNLTVDLEHFAANNTATWAQKQVLGSAFDQVARLTIDKATDQAGSQNSTYWQIYLDPLQNVFGICNGTIVFQAESSV